MAVIKGRSLKSAKNSAEKTKKAAVRKAPAKNKKAEKAQPASPEMMIEQRVEESKYYAGPAMQKFAEERGFEFPGGYGDNRIVAMVRDPHWIYAYWEISSKRIDEIRSEIGEHDFLTSRLFLRVYDIENWRYFDIEAASGAANWYIRVPAPNRSYCVEIGFKTGDGRFIAAARSNVITTPLDRMSDVIDEQWMIPDWDKLYSLSGGFGLGKSSAELMELVKKRFQEETSSGWVSSLSSPVKKIGERPFWLVANAELIVYGATEPSATVTVQGRKIDLRPDGTFSLRYAFPDGDQVIPIEGIRDDGAERRKVTISAERKTKQ